MASETATWGRGGQRVGGGLLRSFSDAKIRGLTPPQEGQELVRCHCANQIQFSPFYMISFLLKYINTFLDKSSRILGGELKSVVARTCLRI